MYFDRLELPAWIESGLGIRTVNIMKCNLSRARDPLHTFQTWDTTHRFWSFFKGLFMLGSLRIRRCTPRCRIFLPRCYVNHSSRRVSRAFYWSATWNFSDSCSTNYYCLRPAYLPVSGREWTHEGQNKNVSLCSGVQTSASPWCVRFENTFVQREPLLLHFGSLLFRTTCC